MKKFLIFLSLILAAAVLASCAAASTSYDNSYQEPQYTTTYASYDKSSSGNYSGSSAKPADFQRKVIKNVTISLEAEDAKAAYDQIMTFAAGLGGYEFSRSQQASGESLVINARIKIAPEHLDALLDYIGSVGTIESEQTESSDITADYYDARTRLATMEKALLRYYDFLEQAKNIDESLKVQNEINQLTTQIESLKGQLALWDNLLAESTVTIYLRQITDPVKTKRDINWSTLTFDDMGYLIKAGLTGLLNAIVVVLQWVAIVLVVTSPVWIIALIVIFIIVRRKRKKAARAAAADSEITQSPHQGHAGK